jgi:hypothetical protein
VQLHGEDALVSIAALVDSPDAVEARMNLLFRPTQPHSTSFLERIRLWQHNSARQEDDTRVNAQEALRLLRVVLRLHRDVPEYRKRVSQPPHVWELARVRACLSSSSSVSSSAAAAAAVVGAAAAVAAGIDSACC